MKKILALLSLLPALAWSSGASVQLDHAPADPQDKASLQRGAAIFVNHCLNCHGAQSMRYIRLTDIGLTEEQIRLNLLLAAEKVGESMTTALDPAIAKAAFSVVPPDLSLAARSRSTAWLYTYLRSFYRDPAAKTGWNNTLFPNVAMPHALWEYQGEQLLQVSERQDPNTGDMIRTSRFVVDRPGTMSRVDYDRYVGDLVNFLAYMSEPGANERKQWGILVMFFLAGFFIVMLLLKKEFWKDVK